MIQSKPYYKTSIASKMLLLEPTIIIVLTGSLVLNLVNYSACHPSNLNVNHCGTWSKSTCTDDITTAWNKNFVGENLKQWITSISKIRSIPEKDKESIFLSKAVLMYEKTYLIGNITGGGVYYISNSDCSKKRKIGPKWRKASMFSNNQFDDGFLYSNGNGNEAFTGVY